MTATVYRGTSVTITIFEWTKEALIKLGAEVQALASEESRKAFLAGKPAFAVAWGIRLPLIEAAIDRAKRLPYETGKEANEIGGELASLKLPPDEPQSNIVIRQQFKDVDLGTALAAFRRECDAVVQPRHGFDRSCAKTFCACGHELGASRHMRGSQVFCSAFCARPANTIPSSASSVAGMTCHLVDAIEQFKPVGISSRQVVAAVADHMGIRVDAAELRRG